MTIHRSSTSLLALSLVLPIALVACGGGDSGADPAAPSTATGGSAGAAAGQGGTAAGGAGTGGAAAGTGGAAAGKGGAGGASAGSGGSAGKGGAGTKADTFDSMMRIAVITDMDTGSAFDVCVTDNPNYNETGDAFDGPLAAKYGPDGGNFISAPGVTTYFGATSKVQYLRLVKSVPSDQVQDVKDGTVNLCSSKERIKGIADDKTSLTADDFYTIVIYGSLEDKSSLKTRVIKDDYKAATGDNTALQFFNAVYKTKMRVAYSDGTPLEVFSATDYGKFASQTGLSSAEFQGNYLLTNKFLATDLKLENVDKPEDAVPFGDNDFAAGSNYSIFSFRNSAGLLRAYVCEDKPVQVGAFKDPNDESKGRWPTESPTCTFKLPARSAPASPARERGGVWRGLVPVPRFRVR